MKKGKKRKNKKNKIKSMILVLFILVILAIVLFFYINDFNLEKVKNSTNDILIQMGLIEPNIETENNGKNIKTEQKTTNKSNATKSKTVSLGDDETYNKDILEGIDLEKVTLCEDGCVENVIYKNFEIHFLELGNKYTGDCTYIKAGDVDILIDAGSRQSSARTIKEYVDEYCTDGVLEYVISTHAHQDHIAGFVGTKTETGIFYYYKIETLIEFSKTDVTSQLYSDYLTAVDYMTTNKNTKVYKAGDCFNNENGASSHYTLSSEYNISFDIIYNKYYYEDSSDENNYSVCAMFNYNDYHFLLTGDLEKEGEEGIAEYYDKSTSEKTLPHVVLFKAGHHGSGSSSNDCLLDLITPDICCVCCCAGSTEYTPNYNNIFPTQDFVNRIAKHTDRVYVTTLFDEKEKTFKSMNGDIVISSNGSNIGIYASNNLTKLKDTTWFNEEIYVVLVDEKKQIYNICPKLKSEDFYTSSTEGAKKVTRRIWPTS